MSPRRKRPITPAIGGILAGFDQQIMRTTPPPHELVHHARPDAPVPAADGGTIVIGFPDDPMPAPDGDDPRPEERGR